jgi:hypothetical protein
MQIRIYKGESVKLVVPLHENNMPFDVTQATEIKAVLTTGKRRFKYSLGPIAGHGKLTNALSLVGIPPEPETLQNHEIALYIEASETAQYETGMVHIDVEAVFLDTTFPSGKRVEKFCVKPATVFDVC